jgi:hypothetical protein
VTGFQSLSYKNGGYFLHSEAIWTKKLILNVLKLVQPFEESLEI